MLFYYDITPVSIFITSLLHSSPFSCAWYSFVQGRLGIEELVIPKQSPHRKGVRAVLLLLWRPVSCSPQGASSQCRMDAAQVWHDQCQTQTFPTQAGQLKTAGWVAPLELDYVYLALHLPIYHPSSLIQCMISVFKCCYHISSVFSCLMLLCRYATFFSSSSNILNVVFA